MAARQPTPQKRNNFAAGLNHVNRSLSSLHTGPARSAGRRGKLALTPLQQDIINNRLTPQNKTPGTKTERQLHLLHQKMVDLNAELTPLSKNNKPFSDRAILNEAQKRELIYALKCSTIEDEELGELYQSVLSEEINILSADKNVGPGHSRSTPLSPDELRVLHKTILQRKLDIMDYCAKVLRLHEQAEWVSPEGDQAESVDSMLNNSLAYSLSKPIFTTPHGIDSDSGVYHESQYEGSGTCALHANNHYLSSWCERDGRPFLPLTPRRLEMMLSGLEKRGHTEIKELKTIYGQSGEAPENAFGKIQGHLTTGEKNILNRRESLIKYERKNKNNKMIDVAQTRKFSAGDTSGKVNQLYGLPAKVSTDFRSISQWRNHLSEVEKLEKQQDSICCSFYPTLETGHAICFTKKNNEWYLQDSNCDKPMKCRPGDFIRYILGDIHSVLNSYNYKNYYSLTPKGLMFFHHYEPKDIPVNIEDA